MVLCGEPCSCFPRTGTRASQDDPDWFTSGQNKEQEDELLKKIALLKKEKVTNRSVVLSWIVRRIQPLQKRCSLGFEYSGLNDPSKFSGEKIKVEKAMKLVGVLPPSPLRDTQRW